VSQSTHTQKEGERERGREKRGEREEKDLPNLLDGPYPALQVIYTTTMACTQKTIGTWEAGFLV